MIVLKIIGWVLLALNVLVLLALCVKVRLQVEYSSENTSAVVKWLFLKIKLYPKKKKEKKPKEEKPEEEEEEEEPKPAKPKQKNDFLKTLYEAEGIDGLVAMLQQITAYTKTFFGHLMRGFVIDEFYLQVCCTRSDAAATAIYYGEVCAVLFPMLGALASRCRMKKYDINIYPDFIARFSSADFILLLHFTPIYLLGIMIAYGCKMLFGVLLKLLVKISGAKKQKTNDRNDNKKSTEKSEES